MSTMTRRELMATGFVGAAGIRPAELVQGDDRESARVLTEILREMRDQRSACSATSCPAIESVRAQQRVFLKANGKYPDFIEVGLSVWEDVYDWHVRVQQPLSVSRLTDGRYALAFMFTQLVLRHEMAANYVGPGYDRTAG
jgi:hypothetical protein